MIKSTIRTLALFIVLMIVGSNYAKACDTDDLTEFKMKDYKPCYGNHWCKRVKKG